MRRLFLSTLIVITSISCSYNKSKQPDKALIFSQEFNTPLDSQLWVVEMDSTPKSSVYVTDALYMDTEGGVTVWLNEELSGNLIIEYQRTVIVEDGENDRLSDFNQFWFASDPNNDNIFTRNGKFEEYDNLSQYYVGVGGNYNSTTRFRKYDGKGERIIIGEKNDEEFLLKPNTTYLVKIVIDNGNFIYSMNDKVIFKHFDESPLTKGYFGFRSTWSRHKIDFINIYQINK